MDVWVTVSYLRDSVADSGEYSSVKADELNFTEKKRESLCFRRWNFYIKGSCDFVLKLRLFIKANYQLERERKVN